VNEQTRYFCEPISDAATAGRADVSCHVDKQGWSGACRVGARSRLAETQRGPSSFVLGLRSACQHGASPATGRGIRHVLLVLLALPASAQAQSISLENGVTRINIAQCNGTNTGEVPPLSDDMSLGLTWTVAAVSGSTIASDDVFRLYASSVQPAAGQTSSGSTLTSCTTNVSGSSIAADQVGSDITGLTSTTESTPQSFGTAGIASAAGLACTAGSTSPTIYLCVQWLSSASAVKGYATTTLTLDLSEPAAPTLTGVGAGDGALYPSCSSGSSATSFVGQATLQSNASDVHYSSAASSCTNVSIGGLTNGHTYDVVVYSIDANNNPSVASNGMPGTPIPTSDFWQQYRAAAGREGGGCSTAAGTAGILGGLFALLALRRRRP
jgi:hypothetical protein